MEAKVISSGQSYTTLPASFIRPASDRPNLTKVSDCKNIPLIDLATQDKHLIIRQIGDACEQYGFFQVINHGVDTETMEKMQQVAKEFFNLPVEEKMKLYSDDPTKTMRLSTSFNVKKETVDNWRDYLRLHCYPLHKYSEEWPSNPPSFKPLSFARETDDIIFTEEDAKWVHHPHSDALVVKVKVGPSNVHRVLVDDGSAVNVLSYDAFQRLGFLDKELTPSVERLYGFTGASVGVKGSINLPISMGEEPCVATQMANFMVVDQPMAYNAIIGRPILKEMKVVTSIYHLSMKFPTPKGVGCVRGSQYDSRECYNRALRSAERNRTPSSTVDVEMVEADDPKKRKLERPGLGMCNMISMVETSDSDEEESPEQVATRLKKGKWVRKETSTIIDLLKGITHEEKVIAKGLNGSTGQEILAQPQEDELREPSQRREKGETSRLQNGDTYLNSRMPFGLINAGATYQRLIEKTEIQNISARIIISG